MQVHPDRHEEYIRRHDPIWPELAEALKAHGVQNYSIFLHRETSQLFAYVELRDLALWGKIAETEVCRRWWASMRDLMPAHSDDSPISTTLGEVFHLS